MKVTYIQAEDWEGLYFDGTLIDEGHSLNTTTILSLFVGKTVTEVVCYDICQDYMEELGSLPNTFSELDSEMLSVE